jgi:hypothetical protein
MTVLHIPAAGLYRQRWGERPRAIMPPTPLISTMAKSQRRSASFDAKRMSKQP